MEFIAFMEIRKKYTLQLIKGNNAVKTKKWRAVITEETSCKKRNNK